MQVIYEIWVPRQSFSDLLRSKVDVSNLHVSDSVSRIGKRETGVRTQEGAAKVPGRL
jgi:hypothetical protein